ncbi:MAG TPA: hypothetical protein VFY23_15105 [Candidatus Limnocylindrales bacterium]|nr:hypothetical protein [Candidatus Limnocylindrales bacterium]
MTTPDRRDTAPGMGDPTRSDDIDSPGLRSDTAGSAPGRDVGDGLEPGGTGEGTTSDSGQAAGPAPHSGDASEIRPDPDPGRSGPLGGPLGSAGGGYGMGSGFGTSTGSPDGEDVQVQSGPGPQTDWLRTAPGAGSEGAGEDPSAGTREPGSGA